MHSITDTERTNQPLPSRKRIAKVVNTLRRERAWTQAELASKLGISQGRLSQIESGGGSFSAEQLLLILKIFNVTPALFSDDPVDQDSQLQNALARLGARHLHESEKVLPGVGVDDVAKIVSEALSSGDPRLTTAVAPVLVANIDRLPLTRVHLDLSRAGFERRLPWLCQNVTAAIDIELKKDVPRTWIRDARRTSLLVELFLESTVPPSDTSAAVWDVLDASIRSKKTADEIRATASEPSRKWHIITSLKPEDFAQALRAARVTD
jgi:transcriptional regulator with XRE-family HTH domain